MMNKTSSNDEWNGKELRVAVINNWPFFGLKDGPNGTQLPDAGIDYNILQVLSEVMNFTFRVIQPPDNQWGIIQPDGTVSGMIGMLTRDEADLSIDEITITRSRESVIDFTNPYFIDSSVLISAAPGLIESPFAVFSPFTAPVWAFIGISVPLITIILIIVQKVIETYYPLTICGENKYNLAFNMFRNIVVQGNRLRTSLWPIRIVLISWYLYCFLTYAFYNGILTAVLSVPAHEKPINSLPELLTACRQRNYFPVITGGTSIEKVFKEANSGIYKDLYEYFHPVKSYYSVPGMDAKLKQVLKEKKGVRVGGLYAWELHIRKNGRSLYHIGKERFYMQSYGIACQSGSKLRTKMNDMIQILLASGLINKWSRDELNKVRGSGSKEDTQRIPALNIIQLQGAFFILIIGFFISTVALFAEIIARKVLKV